MDVLKPELAWVDGRCYRIFESSVWATTRDISTYVEENYEDEECCLEDIEIEPHGQSKFKHTFHVAKAYFPYIIGQKHATRKRLETETKTTIQIPKLGDSGDIVIIGYQKNAIASARHRIDLLIESSKKKIRPTHFLSIPLNDGHVIMKFNAFKNDVLTNCGKNARGVDETIFQIPSKLHITIGMLVLLDDTERQRAIDALNHCREHVIKPILQKHGAINIHLKGVDIMNDDPDQVKVLYAKVANPENGLQELVDKIVEHFNELGLMKEENRGHNGVKLHITLMNTEFKNRIEDNDGNNGNNGKRHRNIDRFDATAIIQAHEDTFFGEIPLKQIHLSQRHTIGNNGYYQSSAEVDLADIQ